jgi:hypothetical protein
VKPAQFRRHGADPLFQRNPFERQDRKFIGVMREGAFGVFHPR